MRWSRFFVMFCSITLGELGFAQIPQFTIFPESERSVPSLGNAPIGNVQCGGEGAYIYFRQFSAAGNSAPFIRLSVANGDHQFFYTNNVPDLPDADKFRSTDFAVSSSELYVLGYVHDKGTVSIIHYSSSGNPDGIVKVDHLMFEPMRLLRFDSGNFLIASSAMKRRDLPSGEQINLTASLGLYDSGGKFIKNIVLKNQSRTDSGKESKSYMDDRKTLSLSSMFSEGERAYIVLWEKGTPIVYKINPSGEVTHIQLENVLKGTVVRSIRASAGRMLVEYGDDPEVKPATSTKDGSPVHLFAEYDLTSGELLAKYVPSAQFSAVFACFDWRNTFTGLGGGNRNLTIATGVTR